ncbi:MAG: LLM class flavin-dependent oxidoreductase, partial [Solirubrobacterales bacterium]|nr:LLM class flavin-dependent oxidoreductase [Solirubrobacterales bacterium]
ELPTPWLLGSSAQSAIWAAQLALPYAFADFINAQGSEIAKLYRERFEPNAHLQAPKSAVAVWALAAPTEEEAVFLSTSSRMSFTLLRRGEPIPVPPPEKAVEFLRREGKPLTGGRPGRRSVVGSPERVRAELEAVAVEYGAEEVIVVTITHDHQARRRSYELLAEAFDLPAQPPALTRTPALASPR